MRRLTPFGNAPEGPGLSRWITSALQKLVTATGDRWRGIDSDGHFNSVSVNEDFGLGPGFSPTAIAANQNDYAPEGINAATVIRLASDAPRTITGLRAPTTVRASNRGRTLVLMNAGAFAITLAAEDAGSVESARFGIPANFIIAAKQTVVVIYDATSARWRVIGDSDTDTDTIVPYSSGAWAAVLTAGTGTFTTTSSDLAYTKIGRMVHLYGSITITTAGTATGPIRVTLPFPAAKIAVGAGIETAATGLACRIRVDPAGIGATASILKYDNTTVIASGAVIQFAIAYEATS